MCVKSLSGFEAVCFFFLKCKGAEVCENVDARRAACRMHVREAHNTSPQSYRGSLGRGVLFKLP